MTGSLRTATWARPVNSCYPVLPIVYVGLCWRLSALCFQLCLLVGITAYLLLYPLCPCPHPWTLLVKVKMVLKQHPLNLLLLLRSCNPDSLAWYLSRGGGFWGSTTGIGTWKMAFLILPTSEECLPVTLWNPSAPCWSSRAQAWGDGLSLAVILFQTLEVGSPQTADKAKEKVHGAIRRDYSHSVTYRL